MNRTHPFPRVACLFAAVAFLLAVTSLVRAFDQWGDNGSIPAGGGNGGPGPGGDPGPGGCGNGRCESEPVDVFTGQYLHDSTDVTIPGRMPLRVRRLYRSGSLYQGMFGRGWNMEFNERILVLATNGNLLLRRDNSDRFEFVNQGGAYAPLGGGLDTLVRNPDGTYTLRDKFGGIRNYDNNGCLAEVRDRNGNQLLLTYVPGGKLPISAVSEFSHVATPIVVARDYRIARIELAHSNALTGRFLQFNYDAFGRVSSVTDFTGRTWRYEYDAGGYGTLTAAVTPGVPDAPGGYTNRYGYTAAGGYRLETLIDRRGLAYLTNRYDASGRVFRQHWGGAVYSFGYPNATQRWVTNGNGYRVERLFDTNGNLLTFRQYTAGLRPGEPSYFETRNVYDTNNAQSKTIFPGSNVVARRLDARGNVIETRVKAADVADSTSDQVTLNTYEPRYNLLKTSTDARGNVTTYNFDHENPATPNAGGNLVRIASPAVSNQTYATLFAYGPKGDVLAVTNAMGIVTRFTYEPLAGYLLERVDAAGTPLAGTNRYSYDARGNALAWVDTLGHSNSYVYDALDRRVETVSPAPFSYVTRVTYSASGKPVREERQTGNAAHPWQTVNYTYDLLDRNESVTDDLGNTTRFAYDGNGNQIRATDANTNSTTMAYDERDLLWRAADALSNVVTHTYSPNGSLVQRVDARTNATINVQDRLNRLVAITNADGSSELFNYDAAGNITERRSRAGSWTTNVYDALGRLVVRRYADGATVQYAYDGLGHVLSVTDTNGTWSSGHDLMGRLVATTNAHGARLAYDYDRVGNLARITYPDNTFVNYAYDALGRVTNINYGGTRSLASFSFDPLSRRTETTFGNGTRTTYNYDPASRMADLRHLPPAGPPLARFTYSFDGNGNRSSQTTEGTRFPGPTAYQYDRTYQLTRVQYPGGSPFPTTAYEYDRTGNRTRVTTGAPVTYAANNLNEYTNIAGQVYTYSMNGTLASDGTWTYSFDDDERLTQATRAGVTAHYTYDPFNRRVAKDVNGDVRRFYYNEAASIPVLLGESDAANAPRAKYVFHGLSPIAMIVSNTVFTLHCDHLERPVLVTDEAGAVAWEGAFSAFGEPSLAATNRVAMPLRAPGQYEDPESGLQYNLARYYDPKLGRFLSEDPALEANSPLFAHVQEKNAYGYLRNNPVNGVDPNGQSVLFIFCSAGLPVCSAAIFCSLNVGACSAGLICSANIGYCSLGIACSGQTGTYGACSGGVACSGQVGVTAGACSASVYCSAQANTASACSASVSSCSAQFTPGVDACSASVAGTCSLQVGAVGASACSLQVAGACSAQAGWAGVGACSAQGGGVCSAQAGLVGGSACSAQGAGVCSAQAGGFGASVCSSQGAGACSGQVGGGYAGCSVQGAGACSVSLGGPWGQCSSQGAGACSVAGPVNGTCSASGGSCSGTFGWGASCNKQSHYRRKVPGAAPWEIEADDAARLASLCLEETSSDRCRLRLAFYGCAKIVLLRRDAGGEREVFVGSPGDGAVLTAEVPAPRDGLHTYQIKLINRRGAESTLGPILAARDPGGPPVAPRAARQPSRAGNLLGAVSPLP